MHHRIWLEWLEFYGFEVRQWAKVFPPFSIQQLRLVELKATLQNIQVIQRWIS